MTRKIVAINGSPHKFGNTARLIRWVMEGCEEAGAETETIHLIEKNILYCKGCYSCLRTGSCCISDDTAEIAEMILASDGVVVGSPFYAGHPSAILKSFIDRLALYALYMGIFDDVRTIGVSTSGTGPAGPVAKSIAFLLGNPFGIITANTVDRRGEYQNFCEENYARIKKRAFVLGYRFARAKNGKFIKGLRNMWKNLKRHKAFRRIVLENPDQFGGVIEYWRKKGRL